MNKISKFGIVGLLGLAFDAIAFTVFLWIIDHLMMARVLAFWLAATITWAGNRHFTYKDDINSEPFKQWLKHMGVAHIAGAINMAVFALMSSMFSVVIAFCVGIGVATFINYTLLNRFVFVSSQGIR